MSEIHRSTSVTKSKDPADAINQAMILANNDINFQLLRGSVVVRSESQSIVYDEKSKEYIFSYNITFDVEIK